MKILVVHSELGVLRGGGENFTRSLFLAFAERGHDVSAAFVADAGGRYPFALPSKIHLIPLRGYWARKFGQKALSSVASYIPQGIGLRAQWDRVQEAICWRTVRWHDQRFTRRIKQEFAGRWNEFDAVYVHGSAFLAAHIAQFCPTVLRLPGPVPAELASVLNTVQAVCANGDALNQIQRFLGEHAVELPVGLDTDVFRPGPTRIRKQLGWTKDEWVIGYVGRLAYIKGVDLLVEAFKQVRRSMPQARLLLVGAGEEEGKLRSSLRHELAERAVHLESDVPHEFLAEWYRAMDLFVMPSRYENYSNAVLEALACEVPFLVSDVGGNRRLAGTKGGWTFTSGSIDDLVKSIQFVATNAALAKAQGTFGGEEIRHKYSWKSSAERLEDILHSCDQTKVGTACRP